MKIPNKIDKRTFNSLTKKNRRALKSAIDAYHSDMMLEAAWLADTWDPNNKYMEEMSKEGLKTADYWNKEVKASLRVFKSTTKKLRVALAKYEEAKKNAKST
jgi:hypothetical protein